MSERRNVYADVFTTTDIVFYIIYLLTYDDVIAINIITAEHLYCTFVHLMTLYVTYYTSLRRRFLRVENRRSMHYASALGVLRVQYIPCVVAGVKIKLEWPNRFSWLRGVQVYLSAKNRYKFYFIGPYTFFNRLFQFIKSETLNFSNNNVYLRYLL